MRSLCPNCLHPMVLVRAIGRGEGLADLHIFECKRCRLGVTEAVARPSAALEYAQSAIVAA